MTKNICRGVLAALCCLLIAVFVQSGAPYDAQYELFTLFSHPVTAYGLTLSLSFAVCALLGVCLARDTRLISCFCLCVPFGWLAGRAAYLLFNPENGFSYLFNMTDGGYGLLGVMLGAVLAGLVYAKATRGSFARVMDNIALPGALMLAVARFAEYFTSEGCGMYMESGFFPVAVWNAEYEMWFQAVFMLEGFIALLIFAYLLLTRKKERAAGDTALLFLLLFGAGQVVPELWRADSFLRINFAVRATQIFAAICTLVPLCVWMKRAQMDKNKKITVWVIEILLIAVCGGGDWAADKLAWMPNEIVYLLMALACVGLVANALRVQKKIRK